MSLRPLGTSWDVMAFTVQGCDRDLVSKGPLKKLPRARQFHGSGPEKASSVRETCGALVLNL